MGTERIRAVTPKHGEPIIAIWVQFRLKFCMAFGSLANVHDK